MGNIINTAPCRFCGQMVQIDSEEKLTQPQAEEQATMSCTCEQAVEYQKEKQRKEKAIRAKFSEKMESAKTAVSNAIDRIKGFFNFEWSLPHLKMPHFSISGSFSLNPPSVPSFGVEWYKTGGIMTSPTVFGMNGTRLMVGGEAGAEAILPLAEFYTELNSMLDRKLKAINQNVNAFIEVHNYIDGDEVASRTTEKVSDNLAIATKKRR